MAEHDNGKRYGDTAPHRRNGTAPTGTSVSFSSASGKIPMHTDRAAGTSRTYTRTVRRHMGVVLCALLVGTAVSVGMALFEQPVYRARTSIEYEGPWAIMPHTPDANPPAPNSLVDTGLQTQVKILQSELLSQRVLARMENLPAELRERSWTQAGWVRKLNLPYLRAPHEADFQLRQAMRRLSVRCVARTRMIEVLFDSSDPEFAARFANLLVEEFVERGVARRERERRQSLYERLSAGPTESTPATGITGRLRDGGVRVLDRARVPSLPYAPNLPLHASFGSALGLVAGLGLAAFRERGYKDSVEPGTISGLLHVPELGVIPSARFDPQRRTSGRHLFSWSSGNGEPLELVTLRHRPSLLAESYRTILTSILFSRLDGKCPRIITFTSAGSGEGKTTLVSNLGIALAEIKRRVLLIDADLRNPRLSGVFNVTNSWGLTDILSGTDRIDGMPIEALVRRTEVPGLMLLPSGPATANLSAVLHSRRFHVLLRRFSKYFDAVLIDSCPMLHLQDARILGKLSDAAVLVVRPGASHRQDAREALERLRADNTVVLGLVLNDWDPRASGRSPDQYYGPYYVHPSGISI